MGFIDGPTQLWGGLICVSLFILGALWVATRKGKDQL